MNQIAGFYSAQGELTKKEGYFKHILNNMKQAQETAGIRKQISHKNRNESVKTDETEYLSSSFGLIRTDRLFIRPQGSETAGILYSGEIYNCQEIEKELSSLGLPSSESEAEVILNAYLTWGPDFIRKVNGSFAIAVIDGQENRLLLYRDRAGTKPLFYTMNPEGLLCFASSVKALLACPGVRPQADWNGLNEIFSIGPARTPGCGVYKNMKEVLPGHFLCASPSGLQLQTYWKLQALPHTDSYEETVEKTKALIEDSVKHQIQKEASFCTFLSGGLDSSLISALCARELKKQNRRLTTYSFDFTGNDKNFQSNLFQPSQDRPYVEKMAAFLQTDHHFLECSTKTQTELLKESVKAHGLPAMADVDSSLLYFCSQVGKNYEAAFTGECADEIFGGYPWFHRESLMKAGTFPWTADLTPRKLLLSDEFAEALSMEDYVQNAYETSLAQMPRLEGETGMDARRREISWLNLQWFMATLLNRMDRTSGEWNLTARVPFADYRIIEYLYNVPWEMKAKKGVIKGLLRDTGRGLLPDEVLFRKKSPYPKTYDKTYETLLVSQMRELLNDSSSPLLPLLDRKKTEAFLQSPSDYGTPWYGQLMAGPQLMAYLLQTDFWMREYKVELLLK